MMLSVYLDQDERWPDYTVVRVSTEDEWHEGCTSHEVPAEIVERWERVIKEYNAVQNEISDIYEARP